MAQGKLYNWTLDITFKMVVRIIRIAGWWFDRTKKK